DVKLGDQVGFQYKGKSIKKENTRLLYATDGTIVARLLSDPKLSEFDAVIIDEAHERKIQIDFLLYLLRKVLAARSEFKLVIMSATIDELLFKSYFKEFKFETVKISGKSNYPIDVIYLTKPEKNYLKLGLSVLQDIVEN